MYNEQFIEMKLFQFLTADVDYTSYYKPSSELVDKSTVYLFIHGEAFLPLEQYCS